MENRERRRRKTTGKAQINGINTGLMMEFLLVLEPYSVGGQKKVRAVAPPFQESAKVLPAQFIALIVVQFRPLSVFVPDQRQAGVCHHTKTFVLELEAVINV